MENNNLPVRYRIQFIEPGICNYEDTGDGKVLVLRDALDRMKSSFIGRPVVLCADGKHKNLTAEQAYKLTDEELESLADGIIYNCGWLDNGWQFADCIIWNLETKRQIDEEGLSASCAYIPTGEKEGGTWHAVEYDAEVTGGFYTHMAIVPNPRYEGAKIWKLPEEYQNSLSEKMMKIYQNSKEKKMIFKFFSKEKKNAVDPEPVQEEKMNIDESYIEIDGKQVSMSELIRTYQAEQKEKEIMAKSIINPDDEVDIGDGKKIKAQELVDSYQRACAKTNAEEETPEEKAEREKKEAEEKAAAEKKNSTFKKLDNSMRQGVNDDFKIVISTEKSRLEEGRKKYGSEKGGK